jgi:hypothetical protein
LSILCLKQLKDQQWLQDKFPAPIME